MKHHLRIAADILQRYGIRELLRRVRCGLYYEAVFQRWRADLRVWRPLDTRCPGGLEAGWGSISDLETFRSGRSLPDEYFMDRIDNVRSFYLARWDGAIAHVTWIYRYGDPTPLISLDPGEVEIRRVHTLRAYRGHRLFTHVLNRVLHDLQVSDVRSVYAHVDIHNYASARAFEAVGFERDGLVRLVKRFGLARSRRESHLRADAPASPRLQ